MPSFVFQGIIVEFPDWNGISLDFEGDQLRFKMTNYTGLLTFRRNSETPSELIPPQANKANERLKGIHSLFTKSASKSEAQSATKTSKLQLHGAKPKAESNFMEPSKKRSKVEEIDVEPIAPSKTEAKQVDVDLTTEEQIEEIHPPIPICFEKRFLQLADASIKNWEWADLTATKPFAAEARWGHTTTVISDEKILLLGGDFEGGRGQNCLWWNVLTSEWTMCTKSFSAAVCRSWHSSVYYPPNKLVLVFGGEIQGIDGSQSIGSLMSFDTEMEMFSQVATTGIQPSSRSGHSSIIYKNKMILFGGVKGQKWLNDLHMLDLDSYHWSQPKTSGECPQPRSYHSATLLASHKLVVFGGNGKSKTYSNVYILDLDKMEWTKAETNGQGPSARVGHSATAISHRYMLLYGGWDYTEATQKCFSDAFLFDIETLTWTVVEFKNSCPEGRTGHSACLAGGGLFVFGGRCQSVVDEVLFFQPLQTGLLSS
eukprot:TRINITY_DN10185_c0_g1_i2.p1 TRINITY_DN10185_c0_g1~~TRINITY_DN10185_c0_g1_i2.p1  ORF type:complete len:484 (+),score=76.22 TRINITY_DN10185_c0_g1_i2:71-1522(+)